MRNGSKVRRRNVLEKRVVARGKPAARDASGIEELKRWRPLCPKNEHDLVCPSVTGLPMHASALLQRGFYPALDRAGIRRVRFHDLRHSWASNLLEAGENIATVSRALGHANVYITLKTYAHAIPKPRHGVSDRMAALMKETNQRGYKMGTEGVEDHCAPRGEERVTH